jgi:hypothetical protein
MTAETVRDNYTMLTWQRVVPADSYSHGAASNYCFNLVLAGHSDWRLPTRAELSSLPDSTRVNPAIDLRAFPGTPLASFWSSTIYVLGAEDAWTVEFAGGLMMHKPVMDAHRVRCVR